MVQSVLAVAYTFLAVACGAPLDTKPQCVDFDGKEILPGVTNQLHMDMPGTGFVLEGNALGQEGRKAELHQCVMGGKKSFSWSWKRGTTQPACLKPNPKIGQCLAPQCLSQFSMLNARYGISPLSGKSSGATDLPAQTRALSSLTVRLNVNNSWSDDEQGTSTTYRNSLLLDMFLSEEQPKEGQAVAQSITDEIVVDITYNQGYAPCCGQFPVDAKGQPKPMVSNIDGGDGHKYDFMVTRSGDRPGPPGVTCRMNHFRRVGGAGESVPASIDVLPLLQFVQNYHNGTSGKWLGSLTIGSALYDNTHGKVEFLTLPSVKGVKKTSMISSNVVV